MTAIQVTCRIEVLRLIFEVLQVSIDGLLEDSYRVEIPRLDIFLWPNVQLERGSTRIAREANGLCQANPEESSRPDSLLVKDRSPYA
ncbi:hypothetical protein LCGC14_3013230 [marine sediment metagenome]|uniref:Uncharacterized protein n=1 Tax=marine sediment metagenome TaxID=412755 RepID=A0A0F8WXH9_9ZZZZ